jgi:phosphate transport system substrate-binding protein
VRSEEIRATPEHCLITQEGAVSMTWITDHIRQGAVVTGLAAATILQLGPVAPASADTVKLIGSVPFVDSVVKPHRAEVETATGHTLEVTTSAIGKSLATLIDGNADAAMSAGSVEVAVAAARATGKAVDPKSLQFHEMRKDEIVFIVPPSNPVNSVTVEPLRDILTGKITSWKQVGGKDLAITVYGEAPTGGARAHVRQVVMDGADYTPNIKSMISGARVPEVVPNDEGAIGLVTRDFVNSKSKVLQTKKIERPLGFITVGAPAPKVKQVIDGFKAALK